MKFSTTQKMKGGARGRVRKVGAMQG